MLGLGKARPGLFWRVVSLVDLKYIPEGLFLFAPVSR